MEKDMKGKVVLVTGAGNGIGRTTALEFAQNGANVVVSDIDESSGVETIDLIDEINGNSYFIRADVSKSDEVEAMINKVVSKYDHLDYAVNNAGISGKGIPFHETDEEEWDQVVAINLTGVWLCMKYEIKRMLKQSSGGSIVNISSVAGMIAVTNRPHYVATKHGVVGLTKAGAVEYGKQNIRVNAVAPSPTRTPLLEKVFENIPGLEAQRLAQHPIGRLGKPEDVAAAIIWLCSDSAKFITGSVLPVDGGFTSQ